MAGDMLLYRKGKLAMKSYSENVGDCSDQDLGRHVFYLRTYY